MKAITFARYGGPEVLCLRELEKPVPQDDEVLIRIQAAAVTPTDIAFRSGHPLVVRAMQGIRRPGKQVLGTELSGTIEAVGHSVTGFQPGDEVYACTGTALGAHAEYVCIKETGSLAQKPRNLSFAEAAGLCDGAMTALPFLRDSGRIKPGHKVMVIGASGAVGSYAVQIARHYGAEVTGVCSTPNLDLVRGLGAVEVIDYKEKDYTRTGRKFDIIFDAAGKSSFAKCRASLEPKGIYLSTNLGSGILLHMLCTRVFGGKRAVFSATGLRKAAQKVQDLGLLRELAEGGHIKPVLDRAYPMEDFAAAHGYVGSGHKKGNVVLLMTDERRPSPRKAEMALGEKR